MNTFKRITCLLSMLSVIFAKPVNIEQAQLLAENFFPQKTLTSCEPLNDDLYLSTFKNGGFVLTSADDGFPAILAYSKKSSTGQNPAFEAMCKTYTSQIKALSSTNRQMHADWSLAETPSLNKSSVTSEVQPLITTIWNQAPHYNSKFPTFILPGYSTQQAYAGCVAVVMGQLMNYYEHPTRGYGKRWYYSETTDMDMYANFDTTLYDYENMPDSLCNASSILTAPADQLEDVSLFLLQCATAVEMDFQPDASSSSYEDMMYALRSHFDYNIDMIQREKSAYTDATWNNMIKDELNNGHPLPYRGQGDGGGHAFLLDGYQISTNTYFHFNWGWGGRFNGWFLLSALDPEDGYDFTNSQAAVFNIHPNTDNITRYAHTSFEGLEAGWAYGGAGFYQENGSADMVRTGIYAYGFDNVNQWLISPKIHIPDDNNAILSIWAHMLNSGRTCTIYLSHTDTMRSSFTTELGTITPGSNTWNEYAYSLRSYKNTDVFLGIFFNQSSGYISVDDISITRPKVITDIKDILPNTATLLGAYPNPFNPATHINFRLSEPGSVDLSIYDLKGNRVTRLLSGKQEARNYNLLWNATNMASGIYICALKINNNILETQKLLLVK